MRTNMDIIKVVKKGFDVFAKPMRVGDLDKTKCSHKFLAKNFDDDKIVNVKCYEDGTLDLRGKREEYRIIPPEAMSKS